MKIRDNLRSGCQNGEELLTAGRLETKNISFCLFLKTAVLGLAATGLPYQLWAAPVERRPDILVVTSDNEMPVLRGELDIYDSDTRMPMAIRGSAGMHDGRVVDDFVSLCDLAPTFLEVAGLPVPAEMTVQSLLQSAKRDSGVVGMEGHAGMFYPKRGLDTRDVLHIRNDRTEDSPKGADAGPALLDRMRHQDKFYDLFAANRPVEKLYEHRTDSDQLHNVGADPNYADMKARLASELDGYLKRTGDPRATGREEMFDNQPKFGERKPAGVC